jgi:hypothetical protein
MIKYNFVEEFTKYPGPRFIKLGKYSGERFREEILRPVFLNDDKIHIDATGVLGFSPSFLDEAFSPLAKEYGLDIFQEKIKLSSNNDKILYDKMMSYVKRYLKEV